MQCSERLGLGCLFSLVHDAFAGFDAPHSLGCATRPVKPAASGGQVRRLALASVALSMALYAAPDPLRAAEPAADDGEALARLTAALHATETKEGATSPYLLPLIEELAQLRLRHGDLGEAAGLRRRALKIAIARFGCESPSAAEAMVALALVDIDRRRYLDAEPLLIAAQGVLAERVAQDHPAIATALAALARVALARGDIVEAEKSARQAVEMARRNPHGRSAEPLRALGAALAVEERFDEAQQVLNEALAQDRKHHGPEGIDSARSLAQLANAELRAHHFAEALPLIQQAAAIDQARLGPAHPFIADDLFDLGLAYDGLKRSAEARRAFAAAIEVLQRGAERNTPRVAYVAQELARLDRQNGKEAEAEAASRDAKRILHRAEEEEHWRERRV
jgi:tetratricopeptide (TPR) repeat protein